MNRSSTDFPLKADFMLDELKRIWEEGWLDEFSENHFLINAINGQLPDFRTKAQMNLASPELYYDCDSSINFLTNFSQQIQRLIRLCGSDSAKRFIEDQLSAGKTNYCEDLFFEALHEIHVFTRFTSYGSPKVVYEPELSGKSGKRNPEYRIYNRFAIPSEDPMNPLEPMEDYILDVEVKSIVGNLNKSIDLSRPVVAPIIAIDYEKRSTLNEFCHERGFQVELPDVIHLRDFLNDAADKFEIPTNENHFNILFLNWTYREIPFLNYMEPLSILDNEHNGLLRYKEIGQRFGISKDVFERISAIFIYSYPKQALMFGDMRWVFANKMCAVLFNPNLNPKQVLRLTHILFMAPSANPITPIALSLLPGTKTKEILRTIGEIEESIRQIRFTG